MRDNLFFETVRKSLGATRETYNISLKNILLRIIFIIVLGYTFYTFFGLSFEGVLSKVWGAILSLIWFFLVIPILSFMLQLLIQPGKIYKELLEKTRELENRTEDEVLNIKINHKTQQADKKYYKLNLLIDNVESDDITECFAELRSIDNGKENETLDFPVRMRWADKKIPNPKEGWNTIKRGERKMIELMQANVKAEYLALKTQDSEEYSNDLNATYNLVVAIFGKVSGVSRFPYLLRIKAAFTELEFTVEYFEGE